MRCCAAVALYKSWMFQVQIVYLIASGDGCVLCTALSSQRMHAYAPAKFMHVDAQPAFDAEWLGGSRGGVQRELHCTACQTHPCSAVMRAGCSAPPS